MNVGELRKLLSDWPDELSVNILIHKLEDCRESSVSFTRCAVDLEEEDVFEATSSDGSRALYLGRK